MTEIISILWSHISERLLIDFFVVVFKSLTMLVCVLRVICMCLAFQKQQLLSELFIFWCDKYMVQLLYCCSEREEQSNSLVLMRSCHLSFFSLET